MKLAALALSLSCLLSGAALAAGSSEEVPGQVELVHHLGADVGEQLREFAERYNQTRPAVKVVVSSRDLRHGTAPDMVLLKGEEEARFLAGKPGVRPLHEVMSAAGERLETLRPPATLQGQVVDGSQRLVGLPVMLGTPVLYVNKNLLARAGVDAGAPLATWQDLQDVLGRLQDHGVRCPYTSSQPVWVHLENASAWHNEPMSAAPGAVNVNGLLQVKHLALMSSWYKSRYLHVFGREDEAEERFIKGECAVLTASSARYPAYLRRAGFPVGVSALPHQEEYRGAPQNTLMDGPALWVVNGRSEAQYRAVAKFVSFLLTPENQVELQRHLGGLPLGRAGLVASRGDLLGEDLVNVRVAIATLTNKPATEASRAHPVMHRREVRHVLDEALESVWANQKPPKQALDDAAARLRRDVTAVGSR